MTSVDELSRKGRSFSALCALGREEPMNMSRFTKASGLVPDRAKILRGVLEEKGLITVKVVRVQGPAELREIRLTPLGREVAKRLVEIDDLLRKAGGSEKGRRRKGEGERKD